MDSVREPMAKVIAIRTDLIAVYRDAYARAITAVGSDPALQTLTQLVVRRQELESGIKARGTGTMDPRERGYLAGELNAVRERILDWPSGDDEEKL